MIIKNWKLGEKIGEGACGSVFDAIPEVAPKNVPDSGFVAKVVALPANPKTKKGKEQMRIANTLYAEYMVYSKLFGIKGIPYLPLKAYGDSNGYRYLVMEKLGRTLGEVVEQEGPIVQPTAARIGIELITCLEAIHSKNIIYVDIKPDNFMVSKKEDKVFCADFGICESYVLATKQAHKQQVFGSIVGTPAFLSSDCHRGSNAARRDDMEALMYVLIYMIKGSLPWADAKNDQEGADIKNNTPIDDVCMGMDPVWGSLLQKARDYAFEDKPNYDWFKNQLKVIAKGATGSYKWN